MTDNRHVQMQVQIQMVVCDVVRLGQTGPVAISSDRQHHRMFSHALQAQISQTQANADVCSTVGVERSADARPKIAAGCVAHLPLVRSPAS